MPRLGLRLTPHGHLLLENADGRAHLDKAVRHGLPRLLAVAPVMGWCSSARVRSAKPCRPPSSGGATSRHAMWNALPARLGCRPEAVRPGSAQGAAPQRSRIRHPGPDGADDAGGGIPDGRDPAWRSGLILPPRLPRRSQRPAPICRAFLKSTESGLEPGRPRPLQPRREPPRPGTALRLPGDLHDAAVAQAKAQHLPLGQALREYAGAANRAAAAVAAAAGAARRRALRLAARRWSTPARSFIPLRWTPAEALHACWPTCRELESAGVVVRMPARVARQPAAAPAGRRRRSAPRRRRGSAPTRCSTSTWT